ncbi:hypothetical protein PDL71_15615 [Lacibacter sp. MH-610]|uniref:hypothetical protein n=1 Tax=Lacibacter sp. MH-610 TaxID=3020883 RepID=UPI003891F41B
MQTVKQIIVPFRIGAGKTGNAANGEKRAIVQETAFYPDPLNTLRRVIAEAVNHFPNKEEAAKTSLTSLLKLVGQNANSHVQEWQFGKTNIVFINMPKLTNPPHQHLATIKINGEEIRIR